jgi:hypothetical protein
MTPLAMVFMAVSVTSVVALAAWCYYKVLTAPRDPGDPGPGNPDG